MQYNTVVYIYMYTYIIVIGVLLVLDVVVLLGWVYVFTFLCVCCSHCLGDALKRYNVADQGKFSSNIAVNLSGTSRTSGAVVVGSSGFRIFTPRPISALLSSVGRTNVMLGLIAMATTVEFLYASVKALVCTVGGKSVAMKDMEKSCSFKVSGLLHGRIKGKQCIHMQYTYKCTILYYNNTFILYML